MKKAKVSGILKRTLCVFLAMLMLFDLSGGAIAAAIGEEIVEYETPEEVVIYGSDGEEIERDAEWNEVYPYGVFAFENSGMVLKEGDEDSVIKVYRLGGSKGRATAYISYVPAITESEDGEKMYDYAISANDVVVEYEEARPVAQYQPVGKDPEPYACDTKLVLESDAEGYVLSADVEAESYAWYILSGGYWNAITDSNAKSVPMDAEFIDSGDYDFRCIYTDAEGNRYCTDSYLGAGYVRPEEEVLEEMPEDIELNPEPSYIPLGLTNEGEDPYAGWAFELTFAEGEWCKEIHISTLEDSLPEAYESALITISSCYGGDVLASACQFTVTIEDNDEAEPSTLGFAVSEVKVDKAEGYAELTLERIGGSQRPVTIQYATADGSAKAGKDYLHAEGTLMFYSGIESMPLRVELIDDGNASSEELDFTVEISELLGDDKCSFTDTTKATVKLWNSGSGDGDNLASVLYDAEAVDVSDSVEMNDSSASSNPGAITGYQETLEETEPIEVSYEFGSGTGDLSTQAYYPSNQVALDFTKSNTGWKAVENIAADKTWWTYRTEKSSDGNPGATLYGGGETMSDLAYAKHTYTVPSGGVGLASKGAAWANFNDSGYAALGTSASTFGQMFSKGEYNIRTYYGHDTSCYTGWFAYWYSYTMARFRWTQGNSSWARPSCIERHGDGALNKEWDIAAGDTWETANDNPFTSTYTQTFSYTGNVSFQMEMPYQGSKEREKDVLLDNSAVILNSGNVTRRAFKNNAFTFELSTPNDSNTAPSGCAKLTTETYNQMKPTIEVTKGGANSGNGVYVGSQLKVSLGSVPAGYSVAGVTVFKSTNGGSTWSQYSKFNISKSGNDFYIDLVGTAASPIAAEDLSANFKIRVSYQRDTQINIDLAPSVPRKDDGVTIDASKISLVTSATSAYGGESDHNFAIGEGVLANITYGYNTYSGNDFSTTIHEGSKAKGELSLKPGSTSGAVLSFSATNVQWINFNLHPDDILLINGIAYAGNAKIYLSAADMAGGLNVLYYHKDYQTAISTMTTAIRWIGLYFDANGNGKIDGYYNENTGIFELGNGGTNTYDVFCGYVTAEDTINERALEPVNGCQYFLKVSYNMTPRSLVVPAGESEDSRAQVLPAFITSVNADSPSYSEQTDEQKAYRYIVSGKTKQSLTADETRSSDNHIMYTTAASLPTCVDIPLGGDVSPAEIKLDSSGNAYYEWKPQFMGSMLYPFANPAPITIKNSLAGPTQIVDDYTTSTQNGNLVYNYTEAQLDDMNGYLASFTGSTTFALVTQQQRYTTEQIVSNVTGVTLGGGKNGASHDNDKYYVQSAEDYSVIPDSVTIGGFSTVPDSEYLKVMTSGAAPSETGADMSQANTGMSEFEVDFGINLGSNDIGITDYVTILLDGNRVGFAISVPLGGYEKALGSSGGTGEWSSPLAANKDAWTQFYDFFQKDKAFGDDSYKKAKDAHDKKYPATPSPTPTPAPGAGSTGKQPAQGQPQTPNNTQNQQQNATTPKTGQGSKLSTSKSFSVDFSVSIAFLFEYDPLSNDYYFCMMSLSASASGTFRIEARLTVFPLVYMYLQFSVGVDLSTGLGRVRDSQESDTPILDSTKTNINGNQVELYHIADGQYDGKQQYFEFETNRKAFNLRFDGKLAMQVYESDGSGWKLTGDDDIITGYLSSDGQKDVEVILKETDSMYLDGGNGDKTYKIRLTAMDINKEVPQDKTIITRVVEIVSTRDEVYFEGIEITPALALEIGAGIGVELLKFEAYFVVSLDATITLCMFNEEWLDDPDTNKYEGIGLENFNFSASIGLRVVLLIFTFELNAATFWAGYDGHVADGADGKGWDYSISFFNGAIELDAETDEYAGMTINLPGSLGNSTKLFTLEDNLESDLSTQAYDSTDPDVPFQLSGYGSSVDAVRLADNMLLGGDYKAVSAGDRDFVVYTLTRNTAAAEDTSYLVMSELASTANSSGTGFTYGLANPNDNTNTTTPYIILDTEIDTTGDLDFDVWVEEVSDSKYVIHAAWVSYAAPNASEPVSPDGTPYGGMNADNYTKIEVPQEPETPSTPRPTEVVTEPAQVKIKDHINTALTEIEYKDLKDDAIKNTYELFNGNDEAYNGMYVLITEQSAYKAALATYASDKAAYDAYVELVNLWEQYDSDLAAYNTALADYTKWYDYYLALMQYDEYVANRLAIASKNTVVKTAQWSFTTEPASSGESVNTYTSDETFTAPTVIGGDGNGTNSNINYVFAPASAGDGSAVFYGSTQRLDKDGEALDAYRTYINAAYAVYGSQGYQNYMIQTKKSMLDVYGTGSALNLAFKDAEGSWLTSTMALSGNQTLGNIEFTEIGGVYYLAYTTTQEEYVDEGADLLKTERLFLRRVTVTEVADGNDTVTWGDAYLLRMTRDYEQNSGKDGVYSSTASAPTTEYSNPYFANLGFLSAKLDENMLTGVEEEFTTQAVEPHDFLIFEMNGSNYIILDDSLQSITDPAQKKGTIHPFFTPASVTDANGNVTTETSTGKQEVTIGVDETGNVFAVYVGAVKGTSNNALYLSAYDAETGTWGNGSMLAMNHMNTYEAALRNGWGERTTSAAFLGLYGKGNGLLTNADINNIYGSEYADDIIATLSEANDYELGDSSLLTFGNIQALKGLNGELLVLTEGTMTELEVKVSTIEDAHYEGNDINTYTLGPTYDSTEQNVQSSIDFYAISYGKGNQALGDGSIAFGNADFSVGSELYVDISAVNAGDTAFRGSKDQPITATLSVQPGDGSSTSTKVIGTWKFYDNIVSGQSISLFGDCLALPNDLQEGDSFVLTLIEDTGYSGGSAKSITLFTVDYLPDLGVENMELSISDISADGSTTTLDVSFMAANRGAGDSTAAYAQFSYAYEDASGETKYAALDIYDSNLEVGNEEKLTEQAVTGNDLKNGILYLGNIGGVDSRSEYGWGRRVSGTITVPSTVFASGESRHLQLKVELFDQSAETASYSAGLLSARHKEYNTDNNVMSAIVEATTEFTAAPSIVIAMGSTTLVSLGAVSYRGTTPQLVAVEVDDQDGKNIGILNFKPGSSDGGSTVGVVSITPQSTGNGIIHVTDTDTNSLVAIAFTVVDAAEGIDIFNDNSAFTFYNADGGVYDKEGTNQDWSFTGLDSWGEGGNKDVPMRQNVSRGKNNASFTFTTVAESIDFFFQGQISVECDKPGFTAKTLTNTAGGNTYKSVSLGANADYEPYTVTVTALGNITTLDRLIEHYTNNQVPTPGFDGENPVLIWTRSVPDTASIKSGGSLSIGFYAIDNMSIESIRINGSIYNGESAGVSVLNDMCWEYSFGNMTQNGNYEIIISDVSGNKYSTTLIVDWFINSEPDQEEADSVKVPVNDAAFYVTKNGNTTKWDPDDIIGKGSTVAIEFKANQTIANCEYEVRRYDEEGETLIGANAENAQSFPTNSNAVYLATVKSGNNCFVNKVIVMDKIDNSSPVATLALSDSGTELVWNASKQTNVAPIESVIINGHKVNSVSGKNLSGTFPITASGKYTILARDAAGNESAEATFNAEIPVNIDECVFTAAPATNQGRNNGSITADLSKAVGGYYTADSNTGANKYVTAYKATLVNSLTDITPLAGYEWEDGPNVSFTGLSDGTYYLAVKDANSTEDHYKVTELVVEDHSIHVSLSYDDGALVWSAKKNSASQYAIDSITINGFQLISSTGREFSDRFILTHNGVYKLIATDTQGNTSEIEVSVDQLSLNTEACSFIANSAWNQNRSNGSIDVDLSGITGGYYLESDSKLAENKYLGRYKVTVVPEDYDISIIDEDAEIQWITLRDTGWTHSFTGLVPGSYKIIVRDGIYDGAEPIQMVRTVTIDDSALEINIAPISSSKWNVHDGQMLTDAIDGIGTHFEYVAVYVSSYEKEFEETPIEQMIAREPDKLEWNVLTNGGIPSANGIIEGLATGHYVIGLRSLMGVETSKLDELDGLAAAYVIAKGAYEAAKKNEEPASELDRLYDAMEAAKTDYDEVCTEVLAASAKFYEDNSEYWDGIVADRAFLATDRLPSNIKNTYVDENGSTVFELYNVSNGLTSSDCSLVASTINNHDVVITAEGFSVYIPEDSLRSGFDVTKLFVNPPEAKDGMVIEYTAPDGSKRIIPWCLVEDGSVSYLSVGEGSYVLVPAEAYFSDVEGLWGEDNIYFTAYRQLFNGIGEGLFGPKMNMTRAMFVTVLWRMAGSPEAEGGTGFTDLKADWYAEAVEWAVENHITEGYSKTVFAPNDNVTREQMCVFLCRFLEYLGFELPEGESIDFADAEKISAWAIEQVDKCSASGLVQGMGNDIFAPKSNATRMEVSTLLARFITQIVEKYDAE